MFFSPFFITHPILIPMHSSTSSHVSLLLAPQSHSNITSSPCNAFSPLVLSRIAPKMLLSSTHNNVARDRQVLRRVALVRRDRLAIHELRVAVCRVHDLPASTPSAQSLCSAVIIIIIIIVHPLSSLHHPSSLLSSSSSLLSPPLTPPPLLPHPPSTDNNRPR